MRQSVEELSSIDFIGGIDQIEVGRCWVVLRGFVIVVIHCPCRLLIHMLCLFCELWWNAGSVREELGVIMACLQRKMVFVIHGTFEVLPGWIITSLEACLVFVEIVSRTALVTHFRELLSKDFNA